MAKKSFGSELRRLRAAANLTMADLADEIGCSIVYISDIERSRRNPPTPAKIRKLLNLMGKGDTLQVMLRLAAEARRSVEIPIRDATDTELTNMLVALAREVDEGALDGEVAKKIRKLLERRGLE